MAKALEKSLLPFLRKSTPRWVIIITDLIISLIALGLAYAVRFDVYLSEKILLKEWEILKVSLPFIITVKLVVFYLFSIHKGLVRYTSTEDVRRIFLAVLTSSVLIFLGGIIRVNFFDGVFLIPTSVLLIEFLTSLFLLIGLRFGFKVYFYEISKRSMSDFKNVLIYGAGVSGLITKRTIEKDPLIASKVIAFIDDNKKLAGNRLEGTQIYHTSKIRHLISKYNITEMILAIQHPDREKTSRIVDICLHYNLSVKRVPSFNTWINGEFSVKQIRKINIDDLLGREKIDLDIEEVKKQVKDKVILVSGAAGSIGSGIVRQLVEYSPKKIVLLDQAESALYDFQNELFAAGHEDVLEVIIGDIRSLERMQRLFDCFKPELVFHAAAYKHVPLMENNPTEAVHTNVLGSINLIDLADQFGADKFVMISTDKAVNPTNVMGASKRIAEMYASLKNKNSNTRFITTRFGNVLGSNGSVIPLFKKQIDKGGPVTVTHPEVTRYFMTIPEACQLVLEASAMGTGGEIFVFDMGESVKIVDLAKRMIKLSGLKLGTDIEIKFTGLRPGEKLFEELLASEENTLPTHHTKILRAQTREVEESKMGDIKDLVAMFKEQNNLKLVKHMKLIVPEFKSNNSEFEKLDE
ncbi:MAG: nucleoside-diphosphate sugar epimerase/dehydratase [Brumimicrobium sp.]|nr:nucleoside-diphosphate sugar epimerase/dehydratase [Brumimicrobium sp.]